VGGGGGGTVEVYAAELDGEKKLVLKYQANSGESFKSKQHTGEREGDMLGKRLLRESRQRDKVSKRDLAHRVVK